MATGNLLSALQLIRRTGRITRKELARGLGLGASMTSKIVSELFEQRLICEVGRSEPESGRPPDLIALNPEAGYAVGLDISGTHQKVVVVNLCGEVVGSLSESEPIPADQQAVLASLEQLIQRALGLCGMPACAIMGVGIGLRAIVNPLTGTVSSWPETPELAAAWKDFAVRDALKSRWLFPHIIVDDIARTLGTAEKQYGHSQGREADFAFVLADWGIGLALMVNGAPYVGPLQIAGEIGHVPVRNVEIHCNCGNVGCLETVASASAVLKRVRERLAVSGVWSALRDGTDREAELTIERVIASAEAGDKLAFQVLTEAGEYFGLGLAIVVNLFGPELVVVGGSLAKSEAYMAAARRSMRLQVLSKAAPLVRVEASQLDELAGARGAATHVLNALFQPGSLNLLALRALATAEGETGLAPTPANS